MLRLFLLLSLFFFNLYSCQGGYSSCIAKAKDAHIFQNGALYIPVKNNKILLYSEKTPNVKILKYDPFLSLYLIEDRKKFPYPFDVNMRLQLGTAVVTQRRAKEGRVLKNQIGLNSLAKYSATLQTPALITSSCCSLEGIMTRRGVIQKEYLKRFLSKTPVGYADIGIRVVNSRGRVVVSARDPYRKNNPFKKGDIIISLDSKRVVAASRFMRKILFSKVGTKHRVKIKRGSRYITINTMAKKRYGGGDISDTFLEQKGIYFDETLHIVKLSKYFREYGLLLGDQLLQVNGTTVKNQEELLRYIEDFKDFSSLLFERKKFQFFVNIK